MRAGPTGSDLVLPAEGWTPSQSGCLRSSTQVCRPTRRCFSWILHLIREGARSRVAVGGYHRGLRSAFIITILVGSTLSAGCR